MYPDIKLVQTCMACPEQYDAVLNDEIVGYLRLRWGVFTVQMYDPDGPVVYSADLSDGLIGVFTAGERQQYLDAAVKAIGEYLDPA